MPNQKLMSTIGNSYVIAVTGGSGSGKTTFVRDIQTHFDQTQLTVVSLDNYYIPRERQEVDAKGISNFDQPHSMDLPKFEQDVMRLLQGEEVVLKEYTFNNALKEATDIYLRPAPIILLEGLFVLNIKRIRDLADLKIFVYAPPVHKLARRIKRDKEERNYPLDDVLYRYLEHVTPAYNTYIEPMMEHADIVVNNTNNMAIGEDLVTNWIRTKLRIIT